MQRTMSQLWKRMCTAPTRRPVTSVRHDLDERNTQRFVCVYDARADLRTDVVAPQDAVLVPRHRHILQTHRGDEMHE